MRHPEFHAMYPALTIFALGLAEVGNLHQMSVWREPRPFSHLIALGNYRAKVTVKGSVEDPSHVRIFRYTESEVIPSFWTLRPHNCVEVLVDRTTEAPNLEAGKELGRQIMGQLIAGELVGTEQAYELPPAPSLVQELRHDSKMLVAKILRHPECHEVVLIGYVPNGYTLPVQTPSISTDRDNEWGRMELNDRLLADTEDEAIELARIELDRCANSDAPVLPLADWNL